MKQVLLSICTLIIAPAVSGPANPFTGTKAQLQRGCNEPKDSLARSVCEAYIGGAFAGMWAHQKMTEGGSRPVCQNHLLSTTQ
jgi:hypothetical protein